MYYHIYSELHASCHERKTIYENVTANAYKDKKVCVDKKSLMFFFTTKGITDKNSTAYWFSEHLHAPLQDNLCILPNQISQRISYIVQASRTFSSSELML